MKPEPTHVLTPDIDIKDRLLDLAECERPFIQGFMREAADEIERMHALAFAMQNEFRAEIERLKAALREIAEWPDDPRTREIARAALEGK